MIDARLLSCENQNRKYSKGYLKNKIRTSGLPKSFEIIRKGSFSFYKNIQLKARRRLWGSRGYNCALAYRIPKVFAFVWPAGINSRRFLS